MKQTWKLDIDCANCALKVEEALQKLPGVQEIHVSYVQKRLTLVAADEEFDAVADAVCHKVTEVEPDAVVYRDAKPSCGEAGCSCGHEHHHEHDHEHHHDHDHEHHHDHDHAHAPADTHENAACKPGQTRKTWRIDIDCPNCAAKLEAALQQVPGVTRAQVNYVQKTLLLEAPAARFAAVQSAVLECAAQVEPDAVIYVNEEASAAQKAQPKEGKKGRLLLIRVGVAVVLMAVGLLPPEGAKIAAVACFVAAYLAAGYDVLLKAVKNIRRGDVFDENFLMAVASLGAMAMGEYAEGIAVMALYQVGEYFQDKAVDKSRASIAALMDIRPDYANLLENGQSRRVSPESVAVEDLILVKPGEKIPLDGQVVEGTSSLNTSALTGESVPRDVQAGDTVLSGCVNLSGLLTVRVTAAYGQSTVAKILQLVESSGEAKADTERFITKFARVYTPLVCLFAVLLAVVPSLLDGQWSQWIYRALTFLVISCPCALVISVPLSFFSGIGGASRRGVLVKGANHIETLSRLDTVVFDKTGTLTKGVFSVTAVHPQGVSREELLDLGAHAEAYSDHPISRSLKEALGAPVDTGRVGEVSELAGRGVQAVVDGKTVYAGNERLMKELGLTPQKPAEVGTVVYVASEGRCLGCLVISDVVKEGSAEAVRALRKAGVKRLVMLTGDQKAVAEDISRALGLTDYRAELLPENKVTELEKLLGAAHQVAFVGDGMNDAPVLRRADVGIAMGGVGSDAAIEAADVVLMDDDPRKLALAVRLARRTMRIVRQNIAFALAVKAVVLVLGACGIANMWLAVFADVGVAMLAILNAMRAMILRKDTTEKTASAPLTAR